MEASKLLRSSATDALALARPAAPLPRRHGAVPVPVPARSRRAPLRAYAAAPAAAPAPAAHNNGVYTVRDFMTKKANLQVVKPSTPVGEALDTLVKHKISGFPVIDDNWKLVGVVSDYDLLAWDSMSGIGLSDSNTSMFPEVDSTWKTFREIQRLLSKTNGKVIGDVMTHAPLVVRENTNLDAVARLLLETKYHRLPVVDGMGKLVGMITRGNVVKAALKIKKRTGENA